MMARPLGPIWPNTLPIASTETRKPRSVSRSTSQRRAAPLAGVPSTRSTPPSPVAPIADSSASNVSKLCVA